MDYNTFKIMSRVRMLLLFIVLLGAINWGLIGIFKFNLVSAFSSLFGNSRNTVEIIIYIIVFISALIIMMNRTTWLPFLGCTVMPKMSKTPPTTSTVDTTSELITDLPPNTRVIYWASKPSPEVVSNPEDAYGDYSNFGIGDTDSKGDITVTLSQPSEYKVPIIGKLSRHIHYRYWLSDGLLSKVYTHKIDE